MLRTLLVAAVLAPCAHAQSVRGTVDIYRKLTKPSVTASIPIYQRGAVVKLGKDKAEDPLAAERARVVLFLEGPGLVASADEQAGEHSGERAVSFTMEQLDRQFNPEVLVVPVGSTVAFPNMDPVFHNIFSLSKPKSFDLGSYDKGESRRVTFPKPGIVSVYCHLHPNMSATIMVTPNRWYARADAAGHYKIDHIPPGHYTVVAWHRATGFLRKPIIVEAGRDVDVDFTLPMTEEQQKAALQTNVPMTMTGNR